MSFDEVHAKKLPPFGIVDLSPLQPFGLLHISAPQYDSTIRSYPDAVLTYLDDDDGETITVGSGVELQQRLEEPVRLGRYRLSGSALPSPRDSLGPVHLFDIQHTVNSRIVWMEHEAYSSKSLRELRSNENPSGLSNDLSRSTGDPPAMPQPTHTDITYPVLPAEQASAMQQSGANKIAETFQISRKLPTAPPAPQQIEATNDQFRNFVEQNVGTFADFLDSAAEVLRNVAQKTREADASPIELMLNGMKDVLSEVGQLGMEVLNGLEYESLPAKRNDEPVSPPEVEAAKDEGEHMRIENERSAPSLSKRVSFADKTVDVSTGEEPTLNVSQPTKNTLADRLTAMSVAEAEQHSTTTSLELLKTKQSSSSRGAKPVDLQSLLTSYSYLPKCAPTIGPAAFVSQCPPYRSFPNRPGPSAPATQKQTAPAPSILDIETTNPDFATRYPPLSLRRAKTVSDLHKSKQGGSESMNTKAALHRYPSIGQLEARRTSYESDHEKPGKPFVETIQKEPQDANRPIRSRSPVSPMASDTSATSRVRRQFYKRPTVEDEPANKTRPAGTVCDVITESGRKSTARPLPGSWPEAKQEDMSALPISTESSGAFFNRMTGVKEQERLPKRSVSPALSCRNTSPPADPFWPSSGLRRAKTVTASNPAARLTRPFDPMSGAANPLFPRGNQQAAHHQDSHQPKRSLTQREPSRPQYPSDISTVDAAHSWSHFPHPAQAPLTQPPFYRGVPQQLQPTPWHSLPPTPQGPSIEELRKAHSGLIPRPDMYPSRQSEDLRRAHPGLIPRPDMYPTSQPHPFAPLPMATSKVDDCVKKLRQMGYGMANLNEATRLNVYAGAAAGDVMEAVEMIEEDRKVAASMNLVNGSIRTL